MQGQTQCLSEDCFGPSAKTASLPQQFRLQHPDACTNSVMAIAWGFHTRALHKLCSPQTSEQVCTNLRAANWWSVQQHLVDCGEDTRGLYDIVSTDVTPRDLRGLPARHTGHLRLESTLRHPCFWWWCVSDETHSQRHMIRCVPRKQSWSIAGCSWQALGCKPHGASAVALHGVGVDLVSINEEALGAAVHLPRIPSVCAVVLEHVPAALMHISTGCHIIDRRDL